MNRIEANLDRYLQTERLLNNFFKRFAYCISQCIAAAVERKQEGTVKACCADRYHAICDLDHPAFDLLRREREHRYGKPDESSRAVSDSPCEYHDPESGCLLKTHKSPTCLAFLCPEAIETLRSIYSIYTYDYLGVYYALEWILTGDLSDLQYHAFRNGILDMTRRIVGGP